MLSYIWFQQKLGSRGGLTNSRFCYGGYFSMNWYGELQVSYLLNFVCRRKYVQLVGLRGGFLAFNGGPKKVILHSYFSASFHAIIHRELQRATLGIGRPDLTRVCHSRGKANSEIVIWFIQTTDWSLYRPTARIQPQWATVRSKSVFQKTKRSAFTSR